MNGEILNSLEICSPFTGELHPLKDVPDEVFSGKTVGDGFCVFPTDGIVRAPADGIINLVFDTKHALVMTDTDGVEYLFHIGIDTVKLNGRGFTAHVETETPVKKGALLLTFAKDVIIAAGLSPVCVCVFTDLTDNVAVAPFTPRALKAGDTAIRLIYAEEVYG